MSILSATVLLFLVRDPVGNVPFFISALRDVEPARHTRVLARELLIALGVLVVFLFAGPAALRAIHISEQSLSIAGGIILFLIALRMVFPPPKDAPVMVQGEPFIVPLAIPFVAGPSAMATVMMMTSQEPERRLEWLTALVLAWILSAAILLLAPRLKGFLGERGLIAMERLMGMLLVAVSVEMMLGGVVRFIGAL